MVELPNPVNLDPIFKQQFAAFMAQGFTPTMSALKIWPHNNGYSAKAAALWQNDPEVLAYIVAAKKGNVGDKAPPTREELVLELLSRANSMEDDDYVKAMRLAAEMMAYMPKGDNAISLTNQIINNRVMVVYDHGTDEEWEAQVKEQQAKLIAHAAD